MDPLDAVLEKEAQLGSVGFEDNSETDDENYSVSMGSESESCG